MQRNENERLQHDDDDDDDEEKDGFDAFVVGVDVRVRLCSSGAFEALVALGDHAGGLVHASTRRRQLSALDDLENYFWHGSRVAIGAPIGRRIEFLSRCVRECDSMGYACAGFTKKRKLIIARSSGAELD